MQKKELRTKYVDGVWSCELWVEHEEPFVTGYYFEDKVTAPNWGQLQIEIGNKNWVEFLTK